MAQQLTPQEVQELVRLYKILDGLTDAAAQNAAQQAQAIGNATNELSRLRREYADFTSDVSSAIKSFKEITSEFDKQRKGINDSKKSYSTLDSIAQKLQYHQKGISTLSAQELETLQKKVKQQKDNLKIAQDTLQENRRNLIQEQNRLRQGGLLTAAEQRKYAQNIASLQEIRKAQRVNNDLLDEQNIAMLQLNESLGEATRKEKEIEKSMGLTGTLMKGMSKIPFLGDLPGMSGVLGEVEEDIRSIQTDTGKSVSRTEAMGMAFKKMGPAIKGGLIDPLTIGLFIFNQLKEAFKAIDESAGELAKSMNITYSEALAFRGELSSIANQSDSIFVTTKALGESYAAISNSLGANVKISAEELEIFTQLREQAGFTNEELIGINKISMALGKNVKDTTTNFLGSAKALALQKGLSINVKQLLKETANVSNSIKLSLGGSETALAKAMISAKGLGTSLEKVDQIAGSLLNFEESISAELEAELLTGKELNLETARYAALTGDIATVAEEIKKQIGGSAEFSKMNRIQQEAFARAVGMSREDLANALVEQEALTRMGRALTDEEKRAYEFAKQKYGEKEAAAMLGRGELDTMMKQQSVQERFNKAVEKLKDIFVSIMEGPIGMILDALATMLSNVTAISAVLGGIVGFMVGGPIGALIGAAAGGAYGAVKTSGNINTPKSTYIKDGMINPEGGLIVSGKKGTYSLDKNDTVIAGTNLNKNSGGSSVSMQPVIDRLAAVENVLVQILNKETNVYMDSTKVGTALNIGTVKIQ